MYRKTIFLICLCFFFCYGNAQKETEKDIEKLKDEIFFDKTYSMSQGAADTLIRRYKNKKWKRSKRFPFFGKKYDAGSCWFDVKKLQKFEDQINKTGVKVSGYRFYYIAYGKRKRDPHVPPILDGFKHTKKIHSLLIVATEDKNGVQTDIIYKNRVAAFLSKIENEGTLCPPLPPKDCNGAILGNNVYGPPQP